MKNTYKFSFALFMIFCIVPAIGISQIYVKNDAAGSNDGTSWTDAFNELQDAINVSSEGDQIWIAAGTYTPGGADTLSRDSFYFLPHNLELYGGFVGTETMLTERDFTVNLSILSGDHLGDDNDGDFVNNKSDNARHVMWLTDTVNNATIIDGITFAYGITEPAAGAGNDRRGGGILTYGAPIIRNCTFTQCWGWFGGGLYPRLDGADGVVIDNCIFNSNGGGFGGGAYCNATSATITNCTFEDNLVDNLAGGLYNGSELGSIIANCTFENNEALTSRGGGLYNTNSPSTIRDCDFIGNIAAASSGGGLQLRSGVPNEPFVINCVFEGNEATWGGAIGSYDETSTNNIINCTFDSNESANVGGAISNAFGATSIIKGCTFLDNTTGGSGGAIFSQNDTAVVSIDSCFFGENQANFGGAINIGSEDDPFARPPMLTVNRSVFLSNSATPQGGAINLGNANCDITNSVFDFNIAVEPNNASVGGAISQNASDSFNITLNITNSTFAGNEGDVGAGISQWVDPAGVDGVGVLNIVNTIFQNDEGDNYAIEAGAPTFNSMGGNLSSDSTMDTLLTQASDFNSTDPVFSNYNSGDYTLAPGSPAIDAAIDSLAPATDIVGTPRFGAGADIGAYESTIVNTRNLDKDFGHLVVFPNPVADQLHFAFNSAYQGPVIVEVTDMQGKIIASVRTNKVERVFRYQQNVSQLPDATYMITISNGDQVANRSFLKKSSK